MVFQPLHLTRAVCSALLRGDSENGARTNSLEKTIILVVEDEGLVRLATASFLEDAGRAFANALPAEPLN